MKKLKDIFDYLFCYIGWAIGPPTIGPGWIILFLLLVALTVLAQC